MLALASLLLAATVAAPRQLPPELDAYIESARQRANVPGLAVAVVDEHGLVAAKGYGVRRLGAPERVDGDTHFDTASLTKSFTAALLATLVDEGKLRWDDRVRDVLPEISFGDPYIDANVTLRDLLTHRVALQAANGMPRLSNYDQAEVLRRLRYLKPQGQFRADFVYSNLMYTVAGAMAEKVTGKTWRALVTERLLTPLGMTATNAEEDLSVPNSASPHAVIDDVQQPIRPYYWKTMAPSAAIASTARDMARWLQFQLGDGTWEGKRIISAAAMEEMHSPQFVIRTTAAMRAARNVDYFAGYGLGWQVFDYKGRTTFWHSGNGDGMPSYMSILPKQKLGVIVMTNTWVTPLLHGSLAGRILDTFLGLETSDNVAETIAAADRERERVTKAIADMEKERTKNTKLSVPLTQYAGTYNDPLFGDMTVTVDGERATLQFAGGAIADLYHWHYDTFDVQWRDPVYRAYFRTAAAFSLDADGKPSRLDMRINRDTIEAKRK
ncbi:MAG TPA: serine hydrolase [Thermoanaerobaculia bacterium]|nr:serine hydrolase [Thermoanaerobaculia bacterium]